MKQKYLHVSMWSTAEINQELSSDHPMGTPEEICQQVASFFTGDRHAARWLKERGITGFENIKVRIHLTNNPDRVKKKKRKKK